MVKNVVSGPILAQIQAAKKFFFRSLPLSVTRYHGQLSLCTISEKTNDPNLVMDRWTGRLTGGQTDKNDFIGRCPTKVIRPIINVGIFRIDIYYILKK